MKKLRGRWDIQKNWQFLFPILGAVLVFLTSYYIGYKILNAFNFQNTTVKWALLSIVTVAGYFLLLKFFLWCFEKLKHKWVVKHRWQMIAIFIAFAVTGSASGKLAGPITHSFGLYQETSSPWLYWPVRILLIFPLYQVLLVIVGWLFGQFEFFWKFEKKMLKRLGLGFLVS